MAKLERVTAKVFASDAPADKIGQFGSALAGKKLETGDVSTIQALPAYTEGWSSAVISQRNYPVLQETNGVMKNMSYQTAYIMQNGIAEYDPDTEYYTGSICKGIGNTNQYASWGDENVGNDVTDSDYWKNVTPVNYSNITNCLLEVPQRFKLELNDGTLTIKAGSVVIVPYGTEDLTSQYPVGVTFLNDNFKVYDTQFADGKFFVWAELVGDIVSNGSSATNIGPFIMTIRIDNTQTNWANNGGESGTSATTASTTYKLYYNTDTNLIGKANSTTTIDYTQINSLPILFIENLGNNTWGSVTQIFNGIGYIGSTVWVDKGVKGLIPNGRNEDGTLKNIEYTNDTLKLTSRNTTGLKPLSIGNTRSILIGASPYTESAIPLLETHSGFSMYLNTSENVLYINNGTKWYPSENFIVGTLDMGTGGVINSLNAKQPFRAVDYSELANKLSATTLKNSNGYIKFNNGIIIQWGTVSFTLGTSYSGNITFPIAFSSASSYSATINTFRLGTVDLGTSVCLGTKSSTGFYYRMTYVNSNKYGADNVNWIAIGY